MATKGPSKPAKKPARKAAKKPAKKKPAAKAKPKSTARVGRPRKRTPQADYRNLGPPPDDTLEAINWVHRALVVSVRHIITAKVGEKKPKGGGKADDDVEFSSENARRKELRDTAKVMNALVDKDRLLDAEQTVKRDAIKAAADDGPEMQIAPKFDGASHRTTSKRGRPRKR